MTEIFGVWSFNANGSKGTLTIDPPVDPQNLLVSVRFDGLDRIDPWTGTWDDRAKEIRLKRVLPGNVTQDHIGFLGDNDEAHLMLAGSFTESDISPTAARTNYGWCAEWQSEIIG